MAYQFKGIIESQINEDSIVFEIKPTSRYCVVSPDDGAKSYVAFCSDKKTRKCVLIDVKLLKLERAEIADYFYNWLCGHADTNNCVSFTVDGKGKLLFPKRRAKK